MKVFGTFTAGAQREYHEWVAEAKHAATHDTRIETAVAWIAEGKKRHWKYQNC